MLIAVVIAGGMAVVGLAVVIGYLEGHAQRAAWSTIAARRRALAEREQNLDERAEALAEEARELWEWEGQLIAAAECGGCPVCEMRRRRGDRPVG